MNQPNTTNITYKNQTSFIHWCRRLLTSIMHSIRTYIHTQTFNLKLKNNIISTQPLSSPTGLRSHCHFYLKQQTKIIIPTERVTLKYIVFITHKHNHVPVVNKLYIKDNTQKSVHSFYGLYKCGTPLGTLSDPIQCLSMEYRRLFWHLRPRKRFALMFFE